MESHCDGGEEPWGKLIRTVAAEADTRRVQQSSCGAAGQVPAENGRRQALLGSTGTLREAGGSCVSLENLQKQNEQQSRIEWRFTQHIRK